MPILSGPSSLHTRSSPIGSCPRPQRLTPWSHPYSSPFVPLSTRWFLRQRNASVAAKSRRRLVSAAALIVITGGASDGVMNKLLDVSPVAHAVQRTLTSFVPIYRAARTTREVRTLWDTISVVLSPLLPRLPNLEEGARRLLIQAAVRAFLPRAHPKRTPGEWPTHMRALLKAGGIDVGEGDSLKVSLHNYQKTLTDYR